MGKNGRLWTNRAIPGGDGLNFGDAGSVDSSRRFGGLLDRASPKFKFSTENRGLLRFREPCACRGATAGGHCRLQAIRFQRLERPKSCICGGDRDRGCRSVTKVQGAGRVDPKGLIGGLAAVGVTKVQTRGRPASPKFMSPAESMLLGAAWKWLGSRRGRHQSSNRWPLPCLPASPRFKPCGRDGTGPSPSCSRTQPLGKEPPWHRTLRWIRPRDRRGSR